MCRASTGKAYAVISDGQIRFLETGDENVFAYERTYEGQTLTVLCNFGSAEVPVADPLLKQRIKEGKVLISSVADPSEGEQLQPYEGTAWITC